VTRSAAEILEAAGLPPPPHGEDRFYTTCPKCSAGRTKRNQKARCLGVTIDNKGVSWGCNHCGWTGGGYFEGTKANGQHRSQDRSPFSATYDYVDEAGAPLFQVCRSPDKQFPQRRPDGKGGWVWGTKDVRRVLYRLPEVIEAIASDQVVVVVEGEKDVDNLRAIGMRATCNPGGASEPGRAPKWRAEFSEPLRGADVVIIPDNDPAGRAHAAAIANMLAGVAKRIRILDLVPHWPDISKGGDVSDWLQAGHTREELDALIEAAPEAGSVSPGNQSAHAPAPSDRRRQPESGRPDGTDFGAARWRDVKDKHGNPAPSLANAVIGVRALGISCKHDRFHNVVQVEYHGEVAEVRNLVGELTDDTLGAIRSLINNRYGLDVGDAHMIAAVKEIARDNAFDPVLDYLDDCQGRWDGQTRIDKWLTDYCGAPDTPFIRAIGRKHLVASVRRARQPGCKYDDILVMESPEGKNKSTAIEVLAGKENFSDQTILGTDDKVAQEQLTGVWLYEIADLTDIAKADVNRVKAFASRNTDRARPAYGRVVERRPRRCTLWATTNDIQYLKSQTGNRRFLPASVGRIELDRLRRDRDQLWGEAAAAEAAGEAIMLDESLWEAAAQEQEARRTTDPWEEILADIPQEVGDGEGSVQIVWEADGKDGPEERVSTTDLLTLVLRIGPAQQNQGHMRRLAEIMARLGWQRPTNKSGQMRYGSRVGKGYWRPAPRAEGEQLEMDVDPRPGDHG
jgi:predicted P-loop ATPase